MFLLQGFSALIMSMISGAATLLQEPMMPSTPLSVSFIFLAYKHLLRRTAPTTLMVFLGILIDTVAMTLFVPQEKIDELLHKLKDIFQASFISRKQLQSVLDLMSFVTTCVRPGRIFMSALLNSLRGLPDHGKVAITSEIRVDLHCWLQFLLSYNGVSIIPPPTYSANVLFTDACITGAGGHFQEQCFHVAFPNYILEDDDYNINIKEL